MKIIISSLPNNPWWGNGTPQYEDNPAMVLGIQPNQELLIPFADKAFHIDDPLFLDLGKFYFDGINSYYLKPYYYYGIRYENALNSSHSPLGLPPLNFIIYYLFDNPDEKVFHLIYLIFPASVSVFTYLFFNY